MSKSSGVQSALDRLREEGERLTPARRLVLEAIGGSATHLNAEEIFTKVATQMPTLHRATVYRALATMGDLGIVVHTHIGSSGAVYHLTTGRTNTDDTSGQHAHLQCLNCRSVIDIPIATMQTLVGELDKAFDFELHADHVALTGLCADCRGMRV